MAGNVQIKAYRYETEQKKKGIPEDIESSDRHMFSDNGMWKESFYFGKNL